MRFLLLLSLFLNSLFAVVTVAPVDIGQRPGISGQVNASFLTQRGNTESDTYSGGTKIQYDDNTSYVTWAEFSFNYAQASGVKNASDTYAHLRYIHKFNDVRNVNWETFAQSETNQFTNITERFLTGGGLRFNIHDDEVGKIYLGTGVFYEHIDYATSADPTENALRGNFYLAYKKVFSKDSTLSYTMYYQPRANDIHDYLLMHNLELQVNVYLKLYLSLKLQYLEDTRPAVGIKSEDFTQTTSLVYKF
jgi:putative salt-induced outer membrane protein YdiY